MRSGCVLSVIIHDSSISMSHCHVVSFVVFSRLVEQTFEG